MLRRHSCLVPSALASSRTATIRFRDCASDLPSKRFPPQRDVSPPAAPRRGPGAAGNGTPPALCKQARLRAAPRARDASRLHRNSFSPRQYCRPELPARSTTLRARCLARTAADRATCPPSNLSTSGLPAPPNPSDPCRGTTWRARSATCRSDTH